VNAQNGISLTKGLFSKKESFAKSIDSLYLQNGKIKEIQTRFDFFANFTYSFEELM